MSRPHPHRRVRSIRPRAMAGLVALTVVAWLPATAPASADQALAFPADPASGDGSPPCLPTDPFCVAGEAAGAVVADVWISAMVSLWEAGLWLLRLAFAVVDALTTPDLTADGPLA